MAKKNKGNPVHGVLLIDKPGGKTSNRILQEMKRRLVAQKAGHTGALDPLATGLLPLCFGDATKFSQILLDSDKTYQTTAKLGERTDTCDADGSVVETKDIPVVTTDLVNQLLLEHFSGVINQVAPLYSALKVNGRPMYELARAGIKVEAKSREVEIFSIQLDELRSNEIDLTIHCSKGTYIRSIVDELGQLLGCGAHVSRLHRIQHGPFKLEQAVKELEDTEQNLISALLPVDAMILHWPRFDLEEEATNRFLHGNPAMLESVSPVPESSVRVYDGLNDKFIGIGEFKNSSQINPKRVISCDF